MKQKNNNRPAHWMPRKGDIVDYHCFIGREVSSTNHEVLSVGTDHAGQPVAFISGMSSYVSCDALTPQDVQS